MIPAVLNVYVLRFQFIFIVGFFNLFFLFQPHSLCSISIRILVLLQGAICLASRSLLLVVLSIYFSYLNFVIYVQLAFAS